MKNNSDTLFFAYDAVLEMQPCKMPCIYVCASRLVQYRDVSIRAVDYTVLFASRKMPSRETSWCFNPVPCSPVRFAARERPSRAIPCILRPVDYRPV